VWRSDGGYQVSVDRNLVRALLAAWKHPEFRSGLRHLIDLDEVGDLLAALAVEGHDRKVELRALDLLRSALDTDDIRRAAMLLVEKHDIRRHLAAGITDALADRRDLAASIAASLEDAGLRQELRAALESPRFRRPLWTVVDRRDRGRWALLWPAIALLITDRHARRLVRTARRHGVLRELRRRTSGSR
jgi:hypothetical protein